MGVIFKNDMFIYQSNVKLHMKVYLVESLIFKKQKFAKSWQGFCMGTRLLLSTLVRDLFGIEIKFDRIVSFRNRI